MFSEFVSVDAVRIESRDLVNGRIERDAMPDSGKNVIDRLDIRFRSPIVIEGQGRLTIEN